MRVLHLKHPIVIGKLTVDRLTFREHTTAADYLSFDVPGGVAQQIALIASVSGTDVAVIQQLHGRDYLAAGAIVDDLLKADNLPEVSEDAAEKKS